MIGTRRKSLGVWFGVFKLASCILHVRVGFEFARVCRQGSSEGK